MRVSQSLTKHSLRTFAIRRRRNAHLGLDRNLGAGATWATLLRIEQFDRDRNRNCLRGTIQESNEQLDLKLELRPERLSAPCTPPQPQTRQRTRTEFVKVNCDPKILAAPDAAWINEPAAR